MKQGHYQHFLKLYLRDEREVLILEVREREAERLRDALDGRTERMQEPWFFWFDTVDGRSCAVNLSLLQAVHFLWEPTALPPDLTCDDGPIVIALRGREERIEADTDSPEEVFDFFMQLDTAPDGDAYPGFDDADGERLVVDPTEVVYVTAPLHLIEEGRRIVAEELEDTDGGEPEM